MEDAHALHDDLYGLAETLRLLHAKRMEVEDLETRLQRADKTSTVEFSAVQVTWRAVRARYRGFMRRRAATTTNVPVPVPRESEEAVNADAKHGEADTAVTAVRLARVFADVERSVQRLEDSVPRAPRPLLTLSLGNAPFRLPLKDRLRYKHDYEQFKLRWTSVGLVMALANFLWIDALWLDKVTQFLLLWFYTTTTLREHILWVNGSRIRAWWMVHHYLSITLCGVLLIWPPTAASGYGLFRRQFHLFSVYLGIVQWLQFHYQTTRLYTLRALSKARSMDITTDTSIPAQRSLFLLYPFLLGGQLFQLYNAYTLFQQQHRSTIVDTESSIAVDEWYALASAALFFTLGSGNIIATSWIYAGKIRRRVVGGGDAGHAGADSTCVTPS